MEFKKRVLFVRGMLIYNELYWYKLLGFRSDLRYFLQSRLESGSAADAVLDSLPGGAAC